MTLADPDAALGSVADQLLTTADDLLATDSANRNRAACWIGRTAFEVVVVRLGRAKGLNLNGSMRSQLSCLEVAYQDTPGMAAITDYTWSRLSNACHHHAFQLDPSIVEVRHLLDNVRMMQELAARHQVQSS